MEHKLNQPRISAVAIVGGIAIALVCAGGVAVSASSSSWDLERLSEASSPRDSLPDHVDLDSLGSNGIVDGSTRLLLDAPTATFWAALDGSDNVCIVAMIKGADWVAGSGCSEADSFRQYGVNVRIGNPSIILEAYLIPDGMLEQIREIDEELVQTSGNLVLVDPTMPESLRSQLGTALEADDNGLRLFPFPASRIGAGE